jgi:hypothetical protein
MKHAFLIMASVVMLTLALGARRPGLRLLAVVLGSSGVGFTTTSLVLAAEQRRKEQAAIAQSYLEFLQRLQTVPSSPRPQRPRACRGCQHYHGAAYGGTPLICALHPYGPEAEDCADWNWGIPTAQDRRDRSL